MSKNVFYFIIFFLHFSCFPDEGKFISNEKIQSVPLRFTIFSPYTDLDLFSGEDASMQKNNFLLGIFYAESDYLSGLGLSAFILNTSKDMLGIQFSLINKIGGEGNGAQFGIVNYSHEFHGFQLGLVDRANNVSGFQLGLVNNADDVEGIQLGLVNIAKNVTGSQFGLVNIADDQTGISYGLLSFLLKTGQSKLSIWYDTEVPLNISLKAGRKYFYGILELNIPDVEKNFKNAIFPAMIYPALSQLALAGNVSYPYTGNDSYISLGVGTQITIEPVWFGLEAKWRDLADSNGKSLNSLRLQYSFLLGTTVDKIFDYFTVVSLNSSVISGSGTPNVFNPEKYTPNHDYSLSFGAGVQFLFSGIPNW